MPDQLPPDSPAESPVTDASSGGATSETDPDLERLPAAPRRRSPLVALAVIAVGVMLLAHLAPDLRYSTSEQLPVELGPARAVRFDDTSHQSPLRDNLLAATTGLPDYRNAL